MLISPVQHDASAEFSQLLHFGPVSSDPTPLTQDFRGTSQHSAVSLQPRKHTPPPQSHWGSVHSALSLEGAK